MSFIKPLLIFLNYVITPVRIVICLITIYIFFYIMHMTDDRMLIYSYILMQSKFLIYMLSMNVEIDDDLNKYLRYLYSNKKFIVVFNHTTLVDFCLLSSTFPLLSFVILPLKIHKYLGYSDTFNEKVNCVYVRKGETSSKINENVEKRKSGDNVLFIAPGSGNISSNPDNITEFIGTGAFNNKYSILPVLIKYEDDSLHHNSDNGESILHSTLKLFLLHDYKIRIKVCDMIEPDDKETIIEYRDRVYNIMNEEYQHMNIKI